MPLIYRTVALLVLTYTTASCPQQVGIDDRPYILAKLERSIARHENCSKWNNPGCLVFAGQSEAKRTANGYARFKDAADGRLALRRDLTAKLMRCMTVKDIMIAWNGGLYLDELLHETGLRSTYRWCDQYIEVLNESFEPVTVEAGDTLLIVWGSTGAKHATRTVIPGYR